MSDEITTEEVVVKKKKVKAVEEVAVATPLRWEGFQKMLRQQVKYSGKVDGFAGRLTISSLQTMLLHRGYYVGAISGAWSNETISALQAWVNDEHDAGIEVTGKIDDATEAALKAVNESLAK